MACDKATELLDLYKSACVSLRRVQVLPVFDGDADQAVRRLEHSAFNTQLFAQQLYLEHVNEHGCRNPIVVRVVVPGGA